MEKIKKNLGFEIEETPVLYAHGGKLLKSKDHKAITGVDGRVLSVMKNSYHPMTNEDFTLSTERMSEISGYPIVGYSTFKGGRVVLSYLKNTTDSFMLGGYPIDDYLVIGNSHDGSLPFFVGTSTFLIRCQNAFSKITKFGRVKIRHTKSSPERREELFGALKMYFAERESMYSKLEQAMEIKVDEKLLVDAQNYILQISKEDRLDGSLSTRKANQIELLTSNMISEMEDVGYNMFGLFQGVTKYTTHSVNQKNNVFGNMFGSVSHINKRAYEFAVASLV